MLRCMELQKSMSNERGGRNTLIRSHVTKYVDKKTVFFVSLLRHRTHARNNARRKCVHFTQITRNAQYETHHLCIAVYSVQVTMRNIM